MPYQWVPVAATTKATLRGYGNPKTFQGSRRVAEARISTALIEAGDHVAAPDLEIECGPAGT